VLGVIGCVLSVGCAGDGPAGPEPASTAHCDYVPLPATGGAGGTVTAGPVRVGLAERHLDLPVGSTLGGNTSRATAVGNKGWVDVRRYAHSGAFTPSVGIETIPKVKAIAIEAGDETVVLVRTDTIFSDDTITHELADRLGPGFAGKVLWMSSHTHTAAEQYTADSKLQVGGGRLRDLNRGRLIERMEEAARAALDDLRPAQIGIAVDTAFDLDSQVSYDRREENDHLHGDRSRADEFLAVIRIDDPDGTPRAILPVFGNHSAILSDDTALLSTDVSGMYEKMIEEQFDHRVMAVHLQGAAGDVLPSSDRHIELAEGQHDWDFARSEENARRALPLIMPVWEQAGQAMKSELAMEMVTRSIEVGPDWETFTVRDGALRYAPFDADREADRIIYDDDGSIASPIDEFNAPFGAGLCGDPADDLFQGSAMPGVRNLEAYHSCARLPDVTLVLGALMDVEFEGPPICSSTRTTLSALRLGDYLFATGPGEPLVGWADIVRERSPVDPDKTIILGYAQGHIGYLLTADDWLLGGYEPSINLWGPLEGELIAERLAELMPLAMTTEREDATVGGTDRLAGPMISDPGVGDPDPAPMAGTVPAEIPEQIYARTSRPTTGQPAATIPRVTGVARFTWIGEDPLAGTPKVVLEREVEGGGFEPVRRRSGRVVDDLDLLLLWTPLPLRVSDGEPRTHYWTAEWQAVAWHGHPDLPDLADRPGLPLGRYRFAVTGTGYSLTSDPFELVPGPVAVRVSRAGGELRVEAGYEATDGWRMLAMEGISNRWLPVTAGPVTVELVYDGEPVERIEQVELTDGAAMVSPTGAGPMVEIRVFDRFGNRGVAAPPP
jgi:neutral ceramidase